MSCLLLKARTADLTGYGGTSLQMADIKNTIKSSYAYIFLIGVIANAQALFFYTDATDSIRAYGSTQALMTSGRFIGHCLDVLFDLAGFYFPYRYINVLLYILFVALGVIFILLIFDVKSTAQSCLVGAIIMTSAVNSGVLVYYYVAHMYGFCFLLSMFSTYLVVKRKMMVLPAILLMLSLGIYQAYFATVILVVFLYQMLELLKDDTEVKAWFENSVRYIYTFCSSLVLYVAANKFALKLAGLSIAGYANMGENVVPSYKFTDIVQLLKTSYTLGFSFIFTNKYFFCDNIVARISIALSLLIFLYLFVISFVKVKSYNKKILLLLLFIVLPIMLNLPMFVEKEVPERICMNWYFIFILPLLFINVLDDMTVQGKIVDLAALKRAAVPFASLVMVIASLYSTYRNITIYTGYQKANELAEEAVHDIESKIAVCENFQSENEICFIGTLNVNEVNSYFFNIEYSEYLHKLFNRDHSSIFKRFALHRYKYLTPDDIRVARYTVEDMKNGTPTKDAEMLYCISGIHGGFQTIHSNDLQIKQMPSYPDHGCVKVIGGITYVKLSD